MSAIVDYNNARRMGMLGLARAIQNRIGSSRNRFYRPSGGNRLGFGMRQRNARSATFTMNRRKRINSGGGVTTQHDKRFVYAKKRQPRFKRKRWGRFVKKVHAVAEKDYGTRTVVMNKTYSMSNTTALSNLTGSVYLYSQKGSTGEVGGDLNIIGALENVSAP